MRWVLGLVFTLGTLALVGCEKKDSVGASAQEQGASQASLRNHATGGIGVLAPCMVHKGKLIASVRVPFDEIRSECDDADDLFDCYADLSERINERFRSNQAGSFLGTPVHVITKMGTFPARVGRGSLDINVNSSGFFPYWNFQVEGDFPLPKDKLPEWQEDTTSSCFVSMSSKAVPPSLSPKNPRDEIGYIDMNLTNLEKLKLEPLKQVELPHAKQRRVLKKLARWTGLNPSLLKQPSFRRVNFPKQEALLVKLEFSCEVVPESWCGIGFFESVEEVFVVNESGDVFGTVRSFDLTQKKTPKAYEHFGGSCFVAGLIRQEGSPFTGLLLHANEWGVPVDRVLLWNEKKPVMKIIYRQPIGG